MQPIDDQNEHLLTTKATTEPGNRRDLFENFTWTEKYNGFRTTRIYIVPREGISDSSPHDDEIFSSKPTYCFAIAGSLNGYITYWHILIHTPNCHNTSCDFDEYNFALLMLSFGFLLFMLQLFNPNGLPLDRVIRPQILKYLFQNVIATSHRCQLLRLSRLTKDQADYLRQLRQNYLSTLSQMSCDELEKIANADKVETDMNVEESEHILSSNLQEPNLYNYESVQAPDSWIRKYIPIGTKLEPPPKYVINLGDNYLVIHGEDTGTETLIYVDSIKDAVACSKCGTVSKIVHSYAEDRRIQDIPINRQKTTLIVRNRRFKCCNPDCECNRLKKNNPYCGTFTEPLSFAGELQRRTYSLDMMIISVSLPVSTVTAVDSLKSFGVEISHDTIGRLYKRIKLKDNPDVEVIGVDEIAVLTGRKYITIVYDLENNNSIIAVFKGRDGEPFKEWLKTHRKIKIVARDRSSAYASAISEILPDCIQVADRFHLTKNIIDCLKKLASAELPELVFIRDGKILDREPAKVPVEKKPSIDYLKTLNYDKSPPLNSDGTECKYDNKTRILSSKQYQEMQRKRIEKQKLVRDVQAYWNAIETKDIKLVQDKFKLSKFMVNKYINLTEFEISQMNNIRPYKSKNNTMHEWMNVIYKMLRDGIKSAVIYYYIVGHPDFKGTSSSLANWIYAVGANNFPQKPLFNPICLTQKKYPQDITVIKTSSILAYLFTTTEKGKANRDETVGKYIDTIKNKYPLFSLIEEMNYDFYSTIMGTDPSKLDAFIEKYKDSKIKSFCNGIQMDKQAIINSILYKEISSGPVEGCNNRCKVIKRVMYGRCNDDTLATKLILTFMQKRSDFDLSKLVRYEKSN
jgi:transposase